jgi:hypothetical protein
VIPPCYGRATSARQTVAHDQFCTGRPALAGRVRACHRHPLGCARRRPGRPGCGRGEASRDPAQAGPRRFLVVWLIYTSRPPGGRCGTRRGPGRIALPESALPGATVLVAGPGRGSDRGGGPGIERAGWAGCRPRPLAGSVVGSRLHLPGRSWHIVAVGRTQPARCERPGMSGLRSALWLPLFNELADPAVVARLAARAEEMGWDGVFVWDHLCWRAPVRQVADPWITLAAATVTERLRLGLIVTPRARRRPAKVARETATLDRLSGGRLILGVGLGSDRFGGELSATGEELDDRRRGQMLDEALAILTAAWSGQPVHHSGEHYTVDGLQFLPRPVQRPRVPVWVAGFLAMSGPCAGSPATTASSRSTSSTLTSLPRSPLRSPASASTPPRRTTSPSHFRPSRPSALCQGGRHVVADRVRARASRSRPGARRAPRRPGGGRATGIRRQRTREQGTAGELPVAGGPGSAGRQAGGLELTKPREDRYVIE